MGIMETNGYLLNDDGGTRVAYDYQPGTWRFIVRTNAWRKEGIFANDVLVVQEAVNLVNGDWAILEFDSKKIVRQVELFEDMIRLKSLDASLQAIDWPLHKPLPVIGVVKTIIRQRV
jgi:SOS-response transcriptional repressor LexA